jgi:hypothetical protein
MKKNVIKHAIKKTQSKKKAQNSEFVYAKEFSRKKILNFIICIF